MIHVLAAQERNIKNAVERMHKSFSYGNTFIITKEDLQEFEKIKKEHPERIKRQSEIKDLSDAPILKSADRAGYYITAE